MTLPETSCLLIVPNNVAAIYSQSNGITDVAKAYVIDSQDMLDMATAELKNIKEFAKRLEAEQKDLTKPLNDLKQKWINYFKPALNSLEEARKILERSIADYTSKQAVLHQIEHAKLTAKIEEEKAAIEQRAAQAQADGKAEEAAILTETAQLIVAPPVAQGASLNGLSTRTTWGAEVVDKMALIKAVADGVIPDVYLLVDESALNKLAVTLKDKLAIPGARPIKKTSFVNKKS